LRHKYERQCWSCQGKDLENMGRYVKCRSCGATWNYIPKSGALCITEVDAVTDGSPQGYESTRYKPRGVRGNAAATKKN